MAKKTITAEQREKRRFWKHHIDTWSAGNLNQSQYCSRHQLNRHRFVYWKRKFSSQKQQSPISLVEVSVQIFSEHQTRAHLRHCKSPLETVSKSKLPRALIRLPSNRSSSPWGSCDVFASSYPHIPCGGQHGYEKGHQRAVHPGGGSNGVGPFLRASVCLLQSTAQYGQNPLLVSKRFLPVAQAAGEAFFLLARQR